MSDPLVWAGGAMLAAGTLIASRISSTDRRAFWWMLPPAAALVILPGIFLARDDAFGAAFFGVALILRSFEARWVRTLSVVAVIPIAYFSPGFAVVAVALQAWRESQVALLIVAVLVSSAVLLFSRDVTILVSIVLPAAAATIAWTATRVLPSARLHVDIRRTVGWLFVGASFGVLALIPANGAREFLSPGAFWTAFAFAVPGASLGAATVLAMFGVRVLLAVRDEARILLLAVATGALFAGFAKVAVALVALAIPASLGIGVGAAVLWARATPSLSRLLQRAVGRPKRG